MTNEFDEFDDVEALDELPDDTSFERTETTLEEGPRELLTLKLLREAIRSQNPDDNVMSDFAEYVLPHLLQQAIGVTAKGGEFFEELDRKNKKEGKPEVRRDNAKDQSLNTHLLNGLFPANLVEQCLEQLDTTVARRIQERERRLLVMGFILHDFEKFSDTPDNCRKLPLGEQRRIFDDKLQSLGLDYFFNPENPTAYLEYLDDSLCIAYNAQRRWDTNWNFSEYGLQPVLKDSTLICLTDLSCLADSFSSIIKHPQDAEHSRLKALMHSLSDGELQLTYHSITENRGVLTNVVNNAVMEAHTALNTKTATYYTKLLYLPTGVIYLATRNAPPIDSAELPERVVTKIKSLCADQLMLRQTGFGRDGKGMKYADYYSLFFDDAGLMAVGVRAVLRIMNLQKPSVAQSRSENLVKLQQQQILPANYDFTFGDDIRVDQLAEFGDLVSRKIWGERLRMIEEVIKQDKETNKKDKEAKLLPPVPQLDLIQEIIQAWNLTQYLPAIRAIERINESLKENNLKGNTGGVPYSWYFLAAKYLEHNPDVDVENMRSVCQALAAQVTKLTQPILIQYQIPDGWADLRLWVERVVILPHRTPEVLNDGPTRTQAIHENFKDELDRYTTAKKNGRGRQLICSISHSAYTVTEQMESSVLFTPQVYTNKQMLGGSNAKRNISSIAGIEMMLRQVLMNQTQAIGKKFEDAKYRYLYFYPTYYCTPETNRFLHMAYNDISQTRFDLKLRNHFINKDLQADFSKKRYQEVDAFLLDEDLQYRRTLPRDDPQYRSDRTFRLTYPEDQPLTFYFMALPPGRDPTDTESWVMPAWLALACPLILDVKTVASESPIPPFNDGSEFEESVFLDSAPQAFQVLLKRDRFRLDHLLQGWKDDEKNLFPAPLNVLTAAYAIHMDVNSRQSSTGYDPNWGRFTELAKDFETSPLYVFSYLNRWVRNQKIDAPRIEKIQLYAYDFYPCFDPLIIYSSITQELHVNPASPLHHPRQLTTLYRRFYRADRMYNPKTNAVLKPIDTAAQTILEAEPMHQGQTLVDMVAARVFRLMDRVRNSRAEGRVVFTNQQREEERQAILEYACYFVQDVFEQSFAGDRARLSGRQLNLIKDTCEFLYRLDQDKENQARKAQAVDTEKLDQDPAEEESESDSESV
ncbi:type I-D CRISPR-associated protein Cas10d/Csc3 [Candidatus Cyanaurora vandensis]|uniref:type I-D CRISPR-associated protein Cas10d/Csc3 n=1 Tax=Candidatus Cyanaurora vandensis TaxID=2714958 RepID=UPI00257ADD75|nr:type I-D CRISPR-associated protein Cas10d/Csc3 [Candidatus Cyanaurora vandensis]